MSFWTKIGLADANDIKVLQEELLQLKAENLKLQQQQAAENALLHEEHLKIMQSVSELLQAMAVASTAMKESFDTLQGAMGEDKEAQEKLLKKLIKGQSQVQKSQENASQEIVDIKAYMNSLWEATKLVWVNDLLDSL